MAPAHEQPPDPSAPRHAAAYVTLPRDPRCAALARSFLSDRLAGVSAETLASAHLVASELVSNAYRHGEGAITLSVDRFADRLRIEVRDDGSGVAPKVREQGGDDTGGWGLQIVEGLSTRWGAYEGTTHVWADLPLQ